MEGGTCLRQADSSFYAPFEEADKQWCVSEMNEELDNMKPLSRLCHDLAV